MINFENLNLSDKERYKSILDDGVERGCGHTFQSLFIWGNQKGAIDGDNAMFLSCFDKTFYPFPVGKGDKKSAVQKIIDDSRERKIPCLLTGVCEDDENLLNLYFPDAFLIKETKSSWDYVYDINDLADLPGKKYHKKRNHLNNFYKEYQDFKVKVISEQNLDAIRDMAARWFVEKQKTSTEDFSLEKDALNRAVDNYAELDFDGLFIEYCGEVVAFTIASRKTSDTMDVHFEKALIAHQKAYPAINNEFAKYIRNKYPEVKFLNREEDMGIEGLRKAKESYYPHHMVKRNVALLKN